MSQNNRIRDAIDELQRDSDPGPQERADQPPRSQTRAERSLKPMSFVVVETADLKDANADGTVTVPAGETETILEFVPPKQATYYLLATGAADAVDATYRVHQAGDTIFHTESPLGTITDPMPFAERYDRPMELTDYIEYEVTNDSADALNLAARWHLEVP